MLKVKSSGQENINKNKQEVTKTTIPKKKSPVKITGNKIFGWTKADASASNTSKKTKKTTYKSTDYPAILGISVVGNDSFKGQKCIDLFTEVTETYSSVMAVMVDAPHGQDGKALGEQWRKTNQAAIEAAEKIAKEKGKTFILCTWKEFIAKVKQEEKKKNLQQTENYYEKQPERKLLKQVKKDAFFFRLNRIKATVLRKDLKAKRRAAGYTTHTVKKAELRQSEEFIRAEAFIPYGAYVLGYRTVVYPGKLYDSFDVATSNLVPKDIAIFSRSVVFRKDLTKPSTDTQAQNTKPESEQLEGYCSEPGKQGSDEAPDFYSPPVSIPAFNSFFMRKKDHLAVANSADNLGKQKKLIPFIFSCDEDEEEPQGDPVNATKQAEINSQEEKVLGDEATKDNTLAPSSSRTLQAF